MKYDFAIIGGGPAGYVAAERAGAEGMSVVLFEKNNLGGVCLNEGCIPTKALLYSAKVYDTARAGGKYGVTAENVTFDYGRMVDRKNKVVRKLVAGIKARMKEHDVTVVGGEAVISGRSGDGIAIECEGGTYLAGHLLICTGSEAVIPPIEGIADAGDAVVTNREILAMKERPASLVIIGGGVIGMEFASLFNSLGTEVAVIEMLPEILGGIDADIASMLRDIYTRRGVTFHLGSRVTRVNGNEVSYTDAEGASHTIRGERVLLSTGRRPVTSGLGLENIGVATERGAIRVDERLRTNIDNVYAAGDVTGLGMLAHTASRAGEVVVNNMTGRGDAMRYDAVPGVVYTNPEIASVGLSAAEAGARGISFRELRLPMAYSGRFVAENEGGNGICKVIVSETGTVLGVHMLGNPASEIIFGCCMAIEQGMTVADLQKVVFPHPTVSEILKETVFTF